jgi:hypothetical protein
MSPRAQNLLSLGVLAAALVIASLPAKSQTMTTHARGEFDVKLAPLAGLEGRMTIHIADGKHSYDFEYALK